MVAEGVAGGAGRGGLAERGLASAVVRAGPGGPAGGQLRLRVGSPVTRRCGAAFPSSLEVFRDSSCRGGRGCFGQTR
eukprot:9304667-Alexandrium_andersonii.AAC.1